MADTFTSLLRLVLQETGGNQNIWGTINNASAIALLEDAVAARLDLDVTPATDPVTLTSQNGDVDQSRNAIIAITGAPGGTRTIIVPSTSKLYIISNETADDMTIKTVANPGVVISAGTRVAVVVDPVADDVFGIGDIPTATEDTAGILEIATQAEMDAGVLDDMIVTPLKYEDRATSDSLSGHIELADQSEVDAGTETNLAVTPETLEGRQATELLTGLAAIADQTEVDTGTNDTKFITPLKLASTPATLSTFRGCRAYSSVLIAAPNNTNPSFSAADAPFEEAAVPLDSESFDTDTIHDNAVMNTRLSVPAGITQVRLTAGYTQEGPEIGGLHHLRIRKNGSYSGIDASHGSMVPHMTIGAGGSGSDKGLHMLDGGVINCVDTDYFEIYILGQNNNTDTVPDTIWFQMELVK